MCLNIVSHYKGKMKACVHDKIRQNKDYTIKVTKTEATIYFIKCFKNAFLI